MINFRRIFAWPSQSIRARHGYPPPLARDNRNASGLNRISVAVVDVGAVETLDHFGGATAGFDGLEDAEGDERATQSVMQSAQVPEVMSLRYSLPTCVMRTRICVFATK